MVCEVIGAVAIITRAAGLVHPPPGDEIRCARVARGILAGDIANGVIVKVLVVRSADGIQAIQFIVGVVQRFTLRGIHDLADVAVVLVCVGEIQERFTVGVTPFGDASQSPRPA